MRIVISAEWASVNTRWENCLAVMCVRIKCAAPSKMLLIANSSKWLWATYNQILKNDLHLLNDSRSLMLNRKKTNEDCKDAFSSELLSELYLCGAARLAQQSRASFPLRLRLLVSDGSLKPEQTNIHKTNHTLEFKSTLGYKRSL